MDPIVKAHLDKLIAYRMSGVISEAAEDWLDQEIQVMQEEQKKNSRPARRLQQKLKQMVSSIITQKGA